ncbi:hypothetical protein ACVNP0_03555 [Staphylococcus aureus]
MPFLGELGGAATTFSDTDFLTVGIVLNDKIYGIIWCDLIYYYRRCDSNFIKRPSKATAIVLT